jgi:hypothetical protein
MRATALALPVYLQDATAPHLVHSSVQLMPWDASKASGVLARTDSRFGTVFSSPGANLE